MFFVLSGFLITSLLLKELRLTNRVDFGRFYLRRARRLLPALVVVILALAAVLALTVAPDAAERLRGDIVASMFYVTNWWYVVHDLSYFEAIGRAAAAAAPVDPGDRGAVLPDLAGHGVRAVPLGRAAAGRERGAVAALALDRAGWRTCR